MHFQEEGAGRNEHFAAIQVSMTLPLSAQLPYDSVRPLEVTAIRCLLLPYSSSSTFISLFQRPEELGE